MAKLYVRRCKHSIPGRTNPLFRDSKYSYKICASALCWLCPADKAARFYKYLNLDRKWILYENLERYV